MTACWGIVPAAGQGLRMNQTRPKQYLDICQRSVIERSIAPLLRHPTIQKIVVALDPEDQYWHRLPLKDEARIDTCWGGASRASSVHNALQHLAEQADATDWVVVHDAVRPCLTDPELTRLIEQTWDDEVGAVLAIAIDDTVKRVHPEHPASIADTLSRDHTYRRAVTPQMFRYRLLCDALRRAEVDGIAVVDEATAVSHAGHAVGIVESAYHNIKITRLQDLEFARAYLRAQEAHG